MLSDLDVMGYSPMSSNDCALNEVDQSGISARFYAPLSQRALGVSATAPTNVAIVTIDANTEPPGLLTNTCDSRDFLARLVGDLNALGARVIMIDKYFSPGFCADEQKTAHLIQSLNASQAPVVVGQPTHALADQSAGCLALSPRLDFSPGPGKPSNVAYGLNRLNSDTLKVPLHWPVFKEAPSPEPEPIQPAMSLPATPAPPPTPVQDPATGNGLALVAAEKFNPAIAAAPQLTRLLTAGIHPYTTFLPLPTVNAMTALCNAEPAHLYVPTAAPGTPDLCTPWVLTGDRLTQLKASLAGKVVVVGDLSEQDMHPFPGGDRPGVFLQANYVQAILDQRFLAEIPLWVTIAFLVLYVVGVYCLYWAHDLHGEPRLTAEQAGVGSLLVLLVLSAVSFLVLFRFHLFTPLWAIWGSGVFMVFRYLEASGHHRSQHLMAHLAGTGHHPTHHEGDAK
jgi:hypothetical protein